MKQLKDTATLFLVLVVAIKVIDFNNLKPLDFVLLAAFGVYFILSIVVLMQDRRERGRW